MAQVCIGWKTVLVMTREITLYFGVWLIAGAQKTQALLKGRSGKNLKHINRAVHVGVDPKEKSELGLREVWSKISREWLRDGRWGREKSHKKSSVNEHTVFNALWETAATQLAQK